MTLETWDIDRFPVKTAAPTSPGRRDADKWLSENSEDFERSVQPGDLDRLTEQQYNNPDPADRFFGVPTGGGGLGGGGMSYPSEGYNRADRRYPGEARDEESRPQYHEDDDSGISGGGYYMPGITHPAEDEFDDEDPDRHEWETYHIVTRPRNAIPGVNAFDEHEHGMYGDRDDNYDTDRAGDEWEAHPDNWNYSSYNPDAEHEIVHVHPEDHHDTWNNQLRSEDEDFARIAPHGLERESSGIPGHRAYRYEDPHGGTHRLWHNHYSSNGSGWHTSYHNPELEQDQQTPWTEHPDNRSSDSLGEALKRVDRMKTHADVVHSGTGLKPVENLHGVHYVSKRPDGSPHQMLRNFDDSNGNDNWNVVHYPADGSGHTYTEHGADLAGALTQAKSNLTRG